MNKQLHRLDLNLLVILQYLMEERSVSLVAQRLAITPSSVSKSLSKLRQWFDDPLFIRSPQGLLPTPLMYHIEKSLLMASRPEHNLITCTPGYCQHYVNNFKLDLVCLPLPIDDILYQQLEIPFLVLWHKRNSYNSKTLWLREQIKNSILNFVNA
ncbi:TPA: LysR family transcriptional regulator [Providencia rettgeri]|nr:LysR family transcriptional regulator [Providencia rettgeri]HEM8269079.1 LysR family transcriptional regulator [Providencia rettgeri]